MVFRSQSFAETQQMAEFSLKLEFKWLFSPSVSAKQELIIAHFYHVCYHVVLRLWVNLKLIKDTRPRSLLTRVFTFPAPVFFNRLMHPSVPHCCHSLRIRADGGRPGCLVPGGEAVEGVLEKETEGVERSLRELPQSRHSSAVCSNLW